MLPPSNSAASPPPSAAAIPASANISETPITGDTLPEAIAVARDGNPWFLTLNHVNRLANGVITSFTGGPAPGGSGPELLSYSPANDITIGPDNAVWFTAYETGFGVNPFGCAAVALATISPRAAAGTFARVVACPGNLEHGANLQAGIITGPDRNIWGVFQNNAPLGTTGSDYLSIKTDGTIVFQHDLPAGCPQFYANPYMATGLAEGADRAVYVVAGSPCAGVNVPGASSAVIRIDAAGNVTNVFLVPDATRIAAGPDGNLWVTQNGTTNSIARVTPTGTVTEFPIPTPNAQPLGITEGNDGAIWFTENNAAKIGRITTAGVMTEYPTPTTGSGPYGIASLPGACAPGHGLIWFTEANANKIGKIEF